MNKHLTDNMVFVFCPNYSKYPIQPVDQSKCDLVECPECKQSMWLSEKKQKAIKFSKSVGKEVYLACYPCFVTFAKNNRDYFNDHTRINLQG